MYALSRTYYYLSLPFLILFVISHFGDCYGQDGSHKHERYANSKTIRASINWIRKNKFDEHPHQKEIRLDETTLRRMAASRGISVDSVRRSIRRARQPDRGPIDQEAFALINTSSALDRAEALNAPARTFAETMGKPFMPRDSALTCRVQDGTRNCALEKGLESVFEVTALSIQDDRASVSIHWIYDPGAKGSALDKHIQFQLRRTDRSQTKGATTWTVQNTVSRALDTKCDFGWTDC